VKTGPVKNNVDRLLNLNVANKPHKEQSLLTQALFFMEYHGCPVNLSFLREQESSDVEMSADTGYLIFAGMTESIFLISCLLQHEING